MASGPCPDLRVSSQDVGLCRREEEEAGVRCWKTTGLDAATVADTDQTHRSGCFQVQLGPWVVAGDQAWACSPGGHCRECCR